MTPWACKAPLSMGFPRQEYWNGLPFPTPGDLPEPGVEPKSLELQADSLLLSHQERYICSVHLLSCVQLFATPCTVVYQASLSMGFPRQEYWNGLPFPILGDFPDPWIEPLSSAFPALAGGFSTTEPPGKPVI